MMTPYRPRGWKWPTIIPVGMDHSGWKKSVGKNHGISTMINGDSWSWWSSQLLAGEATMGKSQRIQQGTAFLCFLDLAEFSMSMVYGCIYGISQQKNVHLIHIMELICHIWHIWISLNICSFPASRLTNTVFHTHQTDRNMRTQNLPQNRMMGNVHCGNTYIWW